MKNTAKNGSIKGHTPKKTESHDDINSLRQQVALYKNEKDILLSLSNNIASVREKNDLIKIFSSGLKQFFQFTNAAIALIDKKNKIYFPFLFDAETHPGKNHAEFHSVITKQYSLDNPFITRLVNAAGQVSVLLEDVINDRAIPEFIKLNYETGIKNVLITPLKNKMELIGFLYISSDRTDSFTGNFKSVLNSIAPHLSNAVANIIADEEIKYKEFVNQTLLSLSNDMVTVRNRADLLNVIKFGLKKLIYFTHNVITVLNETGETYHAFLLDPDSRAKKFPQYAEMINTPIPVQDGIYNIAAVSDKPVVFDMASFDLDKAPLWFKLNYNAGAKEMLIKVLPGGDTPRHSIILFSDRLNTFDEKVINIIERISSQLSTAATNISANEEILSKERDKSFLLEFSHNIASARTRNDLSTAIHNGLKKLTEIKAYFIRIINDDGVTLSPFMHDNDVFYIKDPAFKELLLTKIPIGTGITAKVMNSNAPVLIDFADEISQGNTDHYIEFWKQLGPQRAAFQKMFGTVLCVGDKKLGILWVIAPKINMTILEGICAQISVAISNIRSNEEITQREEEKSILLSLSSEIAALRSRDDLLRVVNTKIKTLFPIKDFGCLQINDDRTCSTFILDIANDLKSQVDYTAIASDKYLVTDPVFSSILNSDDPIIFNVHDLSEKPGIPGYVSFWKKQGVQQVLGTALRVGGKNIGCAFLHIDANKADQLNIKLLKAVCAQMSVAISNIRSNEQVLTYKRMLEVENDHLKEQISSIYNFNDIIGSGPEMQKVYHLMSLVAESNSTVLLLGETGTGKELIARAIHNASPRKDKLMIKVNCAALPANLIESELFGHERGSFTGAIERRIGKFELANNSTLFLDEIGEMPFETQVKLLRVIQERELERVGGSNTVKVNVRIIAATNRNLEEEVSAGRFRPDLYYRLNVFPIVLPPLRNRLEDIAPLANFFLARCSKNTGRKVTAISSNVIKQLKGYSWPGNVRELEHLIERSILLTHEPVLKEIQLPKSRKEGRDAPTEFSHKTLQDIERSYIIEILRKYDGKIAGSDGAAHLLEIPPTTLHSKMKKLGISKEDYFSKKA